MTFHTIKARLTGSGLLPDYAVQNMDGGDYCAFVDFRDLPPEGENATLDGVIRSLEFQISDKGLLFTGKSK